MRRQRFQLAIIASLVSLAAVFPAGAQQIDKIIDYRDGTILRLRMDDIDLPWRRVALDGKITHEPVRLSKVQQLKLVLTPATDQIAGVRRTIALLGHDNYHVREKAVDELVAKRKQFHEILTEALPAAKDFEVRWRLERILDGIEEREGLIGNDYDQLTIKGQETEIHGDIGRWSITLPYRGKEVTLDRETVLAIRDAPEKFDLSAEPAAVHMDRIARDDDASFPENVVRIDFDRGPRGEALARGTDISDVFVPLGCYFETSEPDSHISIEPYNVGGRSGGQCAANSKPLYQGTMTIRFCKPGNARIPAGVRYVGFWTSHVAPDGTILQAFDARDRQIAEIKTTKGQRDFLAMHTNVPMAYIRIVPDEVIDPDYAIDDLVFDPPKPLSEAGDPDRYSLLLKTGERLYSSGLDREGDAITMKNLTVGVDEVKIPVNEILVFVPPRTPVPEVVDDKRCFIRMADGSVLRARTSDGLKFDRFPEIPVTPEKLVALWGAETGLDEPAEDGWPENGSLIMELNADAKEFSDWTLGKTWIESTDLVVEPEEPYTYATSPPIWFQKPGKRAANSGLLRTSSGEEIVLGQDNGFQLKHWSARGVTIAHGDHEWTLSLNDVNSILLSREPSEP